MASRNTLYKYHKNTGRILTKTTKKGLGTVYFTTMVFGNEKHGFFEFSKWYNMCYT